MSRKKACSRSAVPTRPCSTTPCCGRELPDLLGCRVDGQPLVGRTVGVAGRVERRAEPVRVRRAHPGADARLGAQRGEARRPEQPPVGEDEHVVGGLLDLAQRMAGHQHRATLVRESTHVPAQPPHARRVEAVRRLVEDEDRRVAEHRRGQPQPLPHPEGELPDPPPSVRGEPGLGQDPLGRVRGQPRRRRQDAQVVQRGPPGVAAGRLEDRADLTRPGPAARRTACRRTSRSRCSVPPARAASAGSWSCRPRWVRARP